MGYILTSKDTQAYFKILKRRILPRVGLRVLWKLIRLQFRNRSSYRALWCKLAASLGIHRRYEPILPISEYPAHSHRNVAPATG